MDSTQHTNSELQEEDSPPKEEHLVRSLHDSEEGFRLLVESVQDYAIFMLDPEGYIVTWNAGAERLKGYTASEIIGRHFSRFYTEEDIQRRHPWTELELAIRDGRYEEEGWRIRKDGTRFWANVVITVLRDPQNNLRGFAKVTRDFTERREQEQERLTNAFVGQQRRFLKEILTSVTQGKLILCDVISELPAPLTAEPIGEPIVLTQHSLKELRSRVSEITTACGMPKVHAQDFITAVSECAMNAIQHAGGGQARIFGSPDHDRVQVYVEDQGKGIDLSNLPRATLERGYTTGGIGFGHGFWLIIQTSDKVYLMTGTTGTTVVLEQNSVIPEPSWLHSVPVQPD